MQFFLLLFTLLNLTNGFSYNINNQKNPYTKQSISHLDTNNINNLEKIFYLRNNKYSPFKNFIYSKYLRNKENVTELLEQINNEFLEDNKHMDEEFKSVFNNTFNLIESNVNGKNYSFYDNLGKKADELANELKDELDDEDDLEDENEAEKAIYDMFGIYKKSDSFNLQTISNLQSNSSNILFKEIDKLQI